MRPGGGIEQNQRWRLLIVAVGLTMFSGLILRQLYWYQVADHAQFAVLASEEHQHRRPLAAKRGSLLDAKGHPIALSVMYDALFAYLPEVEKPERTATIIAEALGQPKDEILRRIRAATSHWTLLASRVPANAAARIEAARLPGIELRRIPDREYPEGSLAAQVLGIVGAEGRGLSGLELTLDAELSGAAGVLLTERDTTGSEIAIARKALIPPVPGSDVVLTIDRYIQRVAERELAEAVKANKATGGYIIVMEPATGGILAMASLPTFSLTGETPSQNFQRLLRPTAVTDTYEPGSVMKLITVASALEEHVVTPDSRYYDSGVALVHGTPIRNWDGSGRGQVTVLQIVVQSLNTGSQWVAAQLGADRFYPYLSAFGFGAPTGIRLNGEATGSFRRPSDPGWSPVDLATNSFGQSISVTPIQMITAVAALANDGVRMKPLLVREVRSPNGVETVSPQPARRVVSSETARTMVDMMTATWSQPALQANHLPGYSLAAKSGTADIPDAGGYSSGKTYASFVGFGPIPDPRFAVLVRIDRPEALYGGVVAAPVFSKVSREILTYLKIPASEPRTNPVPAVRVAAPDTAADPPIASARASGN